MHDLCLIVFSNIHFKILESILLGLDILIDKDFNVKDGGDGSSSVNLMTEFKGTFKSSKFSNRLKRLSNSITISNSSLRKL